MIEKNKIYNVPTLTTLSQIEGGAVDLLLQDTSFGVTQNKWDIKPDLPIMWREWERVTKENGAMLFFALQPFASELILSNQKNYRYDLIWYKPLGSGFLNVGRMPMRNHEYILMFYRKLPTYNPQMGVGVRKKGVRRQVTNGDNYGKFTMKKEDMAYDDGGVRYPESVIDITNGDRTTESEHPTQKPVDLIRYLIKTYSNEGDLVYDGYMGSGTTAVAALMENRNFIGSEISPEYHAIGARRIEQLLSAPTLF